MNTNFHQLFLGIQSRRSKPALERDLRHNRQDVEKLSERVLELESRVDQLSLFSMAIWEVLCEHTDTSSEELQDQIARLAEQRAEQATSAAPTCPDCGRVKSLRQGRCLYCSPGD